VVKVTVAVTAEAMVRAAMTKTAETTGGVPLKKQNLILLFLILLSNSYYF
jgi:hypothetical protein